MNLIKFVLNIFLFKFILLYSFNLSSNEETSYKDYFLNKLKQFEDTQIDIDLLFAEYCFFNDDPICYDDDEKETGGNSDEPSDDPNEYEIDSNINYFPKIDTSLYWIIQDGELHQDINILKSNNNVAIEFFENRIFIAFRSSSSHFAGSSTKMIIISSKDGRMWDKEDIIEISQDIREPLFGKTGNQLMFYYLKAGTLAMKFDPTFVYMKERVELGKWSKQQQISIIYQHIPFVPMLRL